MTPLGATSDISRSGGQLGSGRKCIDVLRQNHPALDPEIGPNATESNEAKMLAIICPLSCVTCHLNSPGDHPLSCPPASYA